MALALRQLNPIHKRGHKALKFFYWKKLHPRCLSGFWMCFCCFKRKFFWGIIVLFYSKCLKMFIFIHSLQLFLSKKFYIYSDLHNPYFVEHRLKASLLGCCTHHQTLKMKSYLTNSNYFSFALRIVVLEQQPIADSHNFFINCETFENAVH